MRRQKNKIKYLTLSAEKRRIFPGQKRKKKKKKTKCVFNQDTC